MPLRRGAGGDADEQPARRGCGPARRARRRPTSSPSCGEAAADLAAFPAGAIRRCCEALIGGAVVRPRYGRHPRLAIWGRSKRGCSRPTWWSSAASTRAPGRRSRRPTPGSAGRCGATSACRRRSGASASPRMISPRPAARPQVVLTRALRVEGTPTVPSRWLLRLDGLLRAIGIEPDDPGRSRLARLAGHARPARGGDSRWSRRRRAAARGAAAQLSVTEIETWLRDPYAIYARHILRLRRWIRSMPSRRRRARHA